MPPQQIDQTYWKRPEESIPQYNARIAAYRGDRSVGGYPASMDTPGAQAGIAQGQSTGFDSFNTAIMGLMRKYQQLGTKDFQEQSLDAAKEQNKRISAQTPNELIGASPGLQSGVRSSYAGALDPTIESGRSSAQTFGEQIRSFGDAINTTREFMSDYQTKVDKARDDARAVIKDALTIGGSDSLKGLAPEELASLEKAAGYPKGYIQGVSQTLKERELELKKQNAATVGGLSAAQINQTVNQIAGAFDNEPLVKNYNVVQEGYQTLSNIGTDTTNAADDIAFIYGFAKIMDPNSVVREGEYNTIQKYAQSWASTFGFNAKRIYSNTNFLSKDAKDKMLQVMSTKYGTATNQYNNLRSEYQRQMDDARAGTPRTITDYAGGFSSANQSQGGSGIVVRAPNGKSYSFQTQQQADAFKKAAGL